MTILEAIDTLELHNPFLGTDENLTESFDMAIKALRLLLAIKENGYTGKEMQFRIGGRRYVARELPQ